MISHAGMLGQGANIYLAMSRVRWHRRHYANLMVKCGDLENETRKCIAHTI